MVGNYFFKNESKKILYLKMNEKSNNNGTYHTSVKHDNL